MHLHQKQYLIGPKIHTCDLKNENVFILVGGGFQKFAAIVMKNHKAYEKKLVSQMINNDQSLEWVVD